MDAPLLLRALLAFLALPGLVAFVVPLFVLRPAALPSDLSWTGIAVLAIGLAILGACVRDFYRIGRGTLAPWAPPKRLVIVGLYRFSRNPMYVGVLCIVCGWALLFEARSLFGYAIGLLVLFHLRVIWGEEPWLARTHGSVWQAYAATVPRWIGRIRRDGDAVIRESDNTSNAKDT